MLKPNIKKGKNETSGFSCNTLYMAGTDILFAYISTSVLKYQSNPTAIMRHQSAAIQHAVLSDTSHQAWSWKQSTPS